MPEYEDESKKAFFVEKKDDLQALTRIYSMPELNYIDVSSQERVVQMMKQWPLLAELVHLDA